ncbi:MAG: hypothetical protein OEW11_10095 [Nitrospirota bacterium]|nr:hypothetical protein [Nitrospirota bacterium]
MRPDELERILAGADAAEAQVLRGAIRRSLGPVPSHTERDW